GTGPAERGLLRKRLGNKFARISFLPAARAPGNPTPGGSSSGPSAESTRVARRKGVAFRRDQSARRGHRPALAGASNCRQDIAVCASERGGGLHFGKHPECRAFSG